MKWKYNDEKNRIIINPPKQRLKITGHRMASVLGLNKYQSSFAAWCEIVKLARLPFEDSKYTIFGKVVEPKLIEYVAKEFPNVMSIEKYYGNNWSTYQWNNFIDDSHIFGGIIDAVATKNDKKTLTMVIECKTSSHPESWKNGNVPIDYLLQGCEYAYLKGMDRILFVCTFPQNSDYAHPDLYEVNDNNTIMIVKKLKDVVVEMPDGRLFTFEDVIKYCEEWWDKFIEGGISPEFDEVKDKEYLDIIRKSNPGNDSDLDMLCNTSEILQNKINKIRIENDLDNLEKELKIVKDNIKDKMLEMLNENETTMIYKQYKLSSTISSKFNSTKFKKEHPSVYEDYCEKAITYRLGNNKESEEI